MASQEKPTKPPPQPPASEGAARVRGFGGPAGGGGYPNPPDAAIPDAATLREQWRFAVRQYSRWYSHAWGTAILAGAAFFALGWLVKGSNPLPSHAKPHAPNDANANEERCCAGNPFFPLVQSSNGMSVIGKEKLDQAGREILPVVE